MTVAIKAEVEPVGAAAELRAEIARHGVLIYKVGARASVNPILLSRLLNERVPLSSALVQRIRDAIRAEAAER